MGFFRAKEWREAARLGQGFDGVLRIGDSALREWYGVVGPFTEATIVPEIPQSGRGITVTDLAEEWFRVTGPPFVFAVWAYRKAPPPHTTPAGLRMP